MNDKNEVEDSHHLGEIELFGDPGIASYDAKVPTFLKLTYMTLPIWGIISWSIFWNGSIGGWTDRGSWRELQIAANTTVPFKNQNMPSQEYQDNIAISKKVDSLE